jgi:hypothetical protein
MRKMLWMDFSDKHVRSKNNLSGKQPQNGAVRNSTSRRN